MHSRCTSVLADPRNYQPYICVCPLVNLTLIKADIWLSLCLFVNHTLFCLWSQFALSLTNVKAKCNKHFDQLIFIEKFANRIKMQR